MTKLRLQPTQNMQISRQHKVLYFKKNIVLLVYRVNSPYRRQVNDSVLERFEFTLQKQKTVETELK